MIFSTKKTLTVIASACFVTTTACEFVAQGGIALTPPRSTLPDSTMRDSVFATVERIAVARGFVRADIAHRNSSRWDRCFVSRTHALTLCGKPRDREVHLLLSQGLGPPKLTSFAQSVRREIADSLRVKFAGSIVRECSWKDERDPEQSGCPALSTPAAKSP